MALAHHELEASSLESANTVMRQLQCEAKGHIFLTAAPNLARVSVQDARTSKSWLSITPSSQSPNELSRTRVELQRSPVIGHPCTREGSCLASG